MVKLVGWHAACSPSGLSKPRHTCPSCWTRVTRGEEVLITRHGKAIARLVPATIADRERVDQAISKLKAARAGLSLGGLNWKDLRDEGRR